MQTTQPLQEKKKEQYTPTTTWSPVRHTQLVCMFSEFVEPGFRKNERGKRGWKSHTECQTDGHVLPLLLTLFFIFTTCTN